MQWKQISFAVRADDADELSELLAAQGAEAVTLADAADRPVLEPAPGTTPLWADTTVTALFASTTDIDELILQLQQNNTLKTLSNYQLEIIEDQAWERVWMERFHPMKFGNDVWICPSWSEPPEPQAINIFLDPGLAFGTGTHETTAMCLEWLAQYDCKDLTIMDYGCGSGILAITAAKKGAKIVYAIDYDPQALQATQANADKNGIGKVIFTGTPSMADGTPVDLLLANILAGPLIDLAPRFAALTRTGGSIVLSGITADQIEDITARYSAWFLMQSPVILNDWVSIEGRRL